MEHNEKLTSAPENGSEQVRKLSSSATIGGSSEHNEKLTSAPENGSEQVRKLSSSATVGGSSETNLHIDGKVEQKLLLNLDLHIAPIVMLLYLIAFLDRY
jgi:hypothetical protein